MAKRFDGMEIRELFSKNLKLFRSKQGLSQLALSSRAGLAHNFVNDIENGKKWVSPDTIAKLAEVLDVEPSDFFMSNPLNPPENSRIRSYLDEINERFSTAVGEIKAAYLSENRKTNSEDY
ncbi:MAG: helix-turn-helix domain-containing protein [Treponema sp.]|jgi:transcriptional regulator with XRE-family HTH domain|nr:helix-turn-helix domain-containing protein [Treponema sp.]